MSMQIQIDIKGFKDGYAIGNLQTGERDVPILIPESEYHNLVKDGFFIRDGQSRDSANIVNTTKVFIEQPAINNPDETLLRVGMAMKNYYKQLEGQDLTEADFKEWIASLPEPMKSDFNKKGLDRCRGVLNFQRFILELKDKGLDEYLKGALSTEDYSYYMNHGRN